MSNAAEGPIYVTRGMKAQCSCGTAPKGQYLNIVIDHGVVTGPEQQPVLNTNDHTIDTVIGFGNCTSDSNPKLQMKKGVLNFLVGGNPLNLVVKAVSGKDMMDIMSDIGLVSCKCVPDTPQVWQMGDEEHILDGAPILTKDSVLYCRNGGTITIMEEQESADSSESIGGETEESQEVDVVDSAAQEAVAAAMQKINAAIPPETEANAASQAASQGQSGGMTGGEGSGGSSPGRSAETNTASSPAEMVAMTVMATYPSSVSSRVMPSMGIAGLSADNCVPIRSSLEQRAATLAQNQKIKMPVDALNEQGLITDISKLDAFQMFQQPVSAAGGSAVAAYNAMKQLTPKSAPSFSQVIFDMEAYGAVETPSGKFVPGLSDYLAKQGCGVEFALPGEALPGGQGAAIGLSLNQGVMSYQTLTPDQKTNLFSLMVTPENGGVQNGTF